MRPIKSREIVDPVSIRRRRKKKRWPTHGKRITPNANMDDKLFFLFFLLLGSPIFSKGFSLKLSSEQREVRERETDSDREKEWNREKNSG